MDGPAVLADRGRTADPERNGHADPNRSKGAARGGARVPLPVVLIAAPTGAGKTTAAAAAVAPAKGTCWLADRHDDVDAAVSAIESNGGEVGRVLPLHGKSGRSPNCLYPDIVEKWQGKGYNYVAGYCKPVCERNGKTEECPFLRSIAELEEAQHIVVTKALARRLGFFSRFGNKGRPNVVLDEDPISLLRPPVVITRQEMTDYFEVLDGIEQQLDELRDPGKKAASLGQLQRSRTIADWLWEQINRQAPTGQIEAVEVPRSLRPTRAVLNRTKKTRAEGRRLLYRAFHQRMVQDPDGTVRNVCCDLFDLAERPNQRTVFVTCTQSLFHLRVTIPRKKKVVVLDATGNPELLRPLFAPRPVEVVCGERVRPAGRIVQFIDFNGPRKYLREVPPKAVRIIDAIGDLHPKGNLVLISHKSCVQDLAKASRHQERIETAHFGGLRGRNDLETNSRRRIAAHIVMGSPKTTEEARRHLALAVYGRAVLPFADLRTVRRPLIGLVPHELAEQEGQRRLLEVRLRGYADPRMQAVYDHTVVSELTHAADRARVLIHQDAVVYLVTNEPCPHLWFAEQCFAADFLDLDFGSRGRFAEAYEAYATKAQEMLDTGLTVGNAEVCRAMGQKLGWGRRYWREFLARNRDALEGERKVRWKEP